jgi:hypothetical protein
MPLFDHFHSQLDDIYTWETIHSAWAGEIAKSLNRILPPRFTALERQRFGIQLEVDIATYEKGTSLMAASGNGSATALLEAPVYAPPEVRRTVAIEFPDIVEVRVFMREGGSRLVGAIEIVSPGNKDRPEHRKAFIAKCASYLKDGVSVIIVDVVTSRHANLHDELMRFLDPDGADDFSDEPVLYSSAFRPVLREEHAELDIWTEHLEVGQALPTMPLRLVGDLFVPVDLESTYVVACHDRRMF